MNALYSISRLIDWLDEYMPGSYRQAQVSFHARLPNSIPIGDAMSLTNSLFLFIEPIKINQTNSNIGENDSEPPISKHNYLTYL
jgi:hypothetical protein